MAQKPIDLVVSSQHVLTMEGDGVGYRADSALAVDRGRIVAVGPTEAILGTYAQIGRASCRERV
jgi:5-methylthioadenosine/S-adenosylhomocysteine deaminase